MYFYNVIGCELTPLLQDPILMIHPPFLFGGYMSIIFSYCLLIIVFYLGLIDDIL